MYKLYLVILSVQWLDALVGYCFLIDELMMCLIRVYKNIQVSRTRWRLKTLVNYFERLQNCIQHTEII